MIQPAHPTSSGTAAVAGKIRTWFPFLSGLLVVLVFCLNDTGWGLEYFPGDLGDARFNNYILEHGYRYFSGKEQSFWNAPFMYPEKDVISYSDNLLGTAPLYSLFRIFGSDREQSFQLWYILVNILSFGACFAFLNWLFRNPYAATIGALVFTVSIALESQMTHAQVFTRFPIPLAFWMGLLFMKELKPVYFFAAILTLVYQFYCGVYLGFLLFIPLTICLLLVLVIQRDTVRICIGRIHWISAMVGSILINLVLLYPLIQKYGSRSVTVHRNEYEYVLDTVPTIHSFLRSKSGSLFWEPLNKGWLPYRDIWDHQIFPGGVAMISFLACIILILVWPWLKKRVTWKMNSGFLILLITGVLTFLLFSRIGDQSFYKLVFIIPGFHSLRAVMRIINIEMIFFAVSTAFVALLVLRRFHACTIPVFLLLTMLVVADNFVPGVEGYRTAKKESTDRIKEVGRKVEDLPPGTVISYEPLSTDDYIPVQLDAMLAAQSHNLKSINGYSATSPVPYQHYWRAPSKEARNEWLESFDMSDIEVIVVE